MVQVLFVCMGNICRSPTAEGVFRDLLAEKNLTDRIIIDSAGTLDYHTGEPPDPRAQATAKKHGVDISGIRARQVASSDFEQFHYVLAMDHDNMVNLQNIAPPNCLDRLHLFCNFAHNHNTQEVPDPYYGGPQGFDNVFRLIQDASDGLLNHIKSKDF
ncbi:MAG: phosphotyrosine protein phosphatase [Candidatus Hydrogenedentota bacterium]|nr:MAG: phosphotyrosine protein phosphatase [Candidatus Hydrogenedentota bacterium]